TRVIAPPSEVGRLSDAIETAIIDQAALGAATARDGVPVPELVRQLKASLAPHDHPFVHVGLTSQDVLDTALALALKDCFALLRERLLTLTRALGTLSQRDGNRTLMAMTRMQPAIPITSEKRIGAWRRPLDGLEVALEGVAERCLQLQWGGPVGIRPGPDALQQGARFAAHLGLRDGSVCWHTDRSHLADLANFLSKTTGACGKIGQDVALMAQLGADTLQLSGGGGSSAMPDKQNPILAEVLVALARRTAGDVASMHHALIHEQERSGSAWLLEWLTLPQMLEAAACSTTTAARLLGQIERMGAP
ncbi:MAG: lyase family protein, partial [Pseudomonadota bacterium]